MPAQPAPTTRTSCSPITSSDATSSRAGPASEAAARPPRAPGRSKLLEVLPEHLARARAPSRRSAPGRSRSSAGRGASASTPGIASRHLEAEDLVDAELAPSSSPESAALQQGARRRDRHPLALAERAAGPAGVDEPDDRAVLVELLAEHLRVDRRALRQERRAEAGRERRLRLGDADLGARELRGEAGEEVVERLLAASAARSAAGCRTRPR